MPNNNGDGVTVPRLLPLATGGELPGCRRVASRRPASPRTVLVVANRVLRHALEAGLTASHALDLVATASTIDDLQPHVLQTALADVLLMDVTPSLQPVVSRARRLAAANPRLKIIVIDAAPTRFELLDLLHAGVSGLLLKRASVDAIVLATRAVLSGSTVIPESLVNSLLSQAADIDYRADIAPSINLERLTRRERQIAALIAEGFSNKEIAIKLNIATFTVKSHVHNVLHTLALRTRAQVARSVLLRNTPAPMHPAPGPPSDVGQSRLLPEAARSVMSVNRGQSQRTIGNPMASDSGFTDMTTTE
jgi:DNA-binding NarL/FixJ family response regulator